MKKKKVVVKKKLIGFDQPMLDGLRANIGKLGENETDVLRSLLSGGQKFRPEIEEYISLAMKQTRLSREYVIERLLLEALEKRDAKFRLP